MTPKQGISFDHFCETWISNPMQIMEWGIRHENLSSQWNNVLYLNVKKNLDEIIFSGVQSPSLYVIYWLCKFYKPFRLIHILCKSIRKVIFLFLCLNFFWLIEEGVKKQRQIILFDYTRLGMNGAKKAKRTSFATDTDMKVFQRHKLQLASEARDNIYRAVRWHFLCRLHSFSITQWWRMTKEREIRKWALSYWHKY